MKHTSGPWLVGTPLPGDLYPILADDPASLYCVAWVVKNSIDNCEEGNADLIAAAPDLLEVLHMLQIDHRAQSPHHEDMCDLCLRTKKAIAKAEGGSSEEYDPTPWCSSCRARTAKQCQCGPIAEND